MTQQRRYYVEREASYWIVLDRQNSDNIKICSTRKQAREYADRVEAMATEMAKAD